MVSVLCVTNRWGGLDILRDNLKKQTYKDFEIILVDSHQKQRREEAKAYFSDFKFTHLQDAPLKPGNAWNLNTSYNIGWKACSGEWIFSLQDYIWIPGDAIERFLAIADEKNIAIGIGHKAFLPNVADKPTGKLSLFRLPQEKPTGVSEVDNRVDGRTGVESVHWSWFELNYSFFPKKLLEDIGGFDESLDEGYGCDNWAIGYLAHISGYSFLLDKANECIGYNQCLFPRPKDWEKRHNNKKRFGEWLKARRRDQYAES